MLAILPLMVAAAALANAAPTASPIQTPCPVGAYKAPDGEVLVLYILHPEKGAEEFRFKTIDGRTGKIGDENAVVRCAAGRVTASGTNGKWVEWTRESLRMTNSHFVRDGTTFRGLLVEPLFTRRKVPLVVMVSGSEHYGAVGTYQPLLIAAQGIATFVYDKRGTGQSGGEYTQNFDVLGRDAAVAMAEARRLARGRYSKSGFFGGSQAGWVAPLAVSIAHADFAVVGFGMVMTPLEEDAEQVYDELRRKGYGEDVIAKARDVTSATGAVRESHFDRGYDQVDAVRQRYGNEPWFSQIEGEFTGDILRKSEDELRRNGKKLIPEFDVEWHYDALGLMRQLDVPQLWVIAGSDREAPNRVTLQRLEELRHEGKPIKVMIFPRTDHGITEFVEASDGSRTLTRTADGYFRLVGDWIKGTWRPPYGRAVPADAKP